MGISRKVSPKSTLSSYRVINKSLYIVSRSLTLFLSKICA